MKSFIVSSLLFTVFAGCGGGGTSITSEKVSPPPTKATAGTGGSTAKIVP